MSGDRRSFARYRGTPLVVNFFASWCAPCLAEMPDFEQVHDEVGARVAFVGLNLQDDDEAGRSVVERTGVTYEVGTDPDGTIFLSLDGIAMPTTAFINAAGVIVDVHSGAMSAGELRDRIDDLLLE